MVPFFPPAYLFEVPQQSSSQRSLLFLTVPTSFVNPVNQSDALSQGEQKGSFWHRQSKQKSTFETISFNQNHINY